MSRLFRRLELITLAAFALINGSCATEGKAVLLPSGSTFADVLVNNSCWQGSWSAGPAAAGDMTLCFTRTSAGIAGEIRDMDGAIIPVNGPISDIKIDEGRRWVEFRNVSRLNNEVSLTSEGTLRGYMYGSMRTVPIELRPAKK